MALSGEDIYLRGLLYSPSSTLIPPPTILALSYCHNMNHVTVPGHWPVAHAVLYVEALTRNPPPDKPQLGWNQEFPAPWVSAQFAKYLGLAQRTPKRGVLDSLKDEKDVMLWDTHIMGDRAKFQVLRAFLDEFAKRYNVSCAVPFPYAAFPLFPFEPISFACSSTLTPHLLIVLTHTSFALRYLYFH